MNIYLKIKRNVNIILLTLEKEKYLY